jgi:hypothetical protein
MAGNGGKRPGAGRKKGSKAKKTLEKELVLKEVKERIMRNAQRILDAQFSIAQGQQFLYKIKKKKRVGPKGRIYYESQKPELVTAEWEIEAYLDGLVENGDMDDEKDPSATYYFITTKEPNNMAIDSMMNRVFGRPKDSLDITSGGEPIKGFNYVVPNEKVDKTN